jgi:hypothetical protein
LLQPAAAVGTEFVEFSSIWHSSGMPASLD